MQSIHLSLQTNWSDEVLRRALIPREDWRPCPTAKERGAWEGIPETVRQAMIKQAEVACAADWPHVPASVYLQFSQNGNRTNYEDLHFGRRKILCDLLIGECLEGKGRYLPALLDAVWSVCEESSWCLPAHLGMQRAGYGLADTTDPSVDLFAAETGALLAWTVYCLGEQLAEFSSLVLPRISREIQDRILTPALIRDDLFWMGFIQRPVNNWNPWINSNWLACALLIEPDAQRRLAAVSKIVRSLDVFLGDYPEDGGCDEGPSYWGRAGASLFDCLELLYSASGGRLSVFFDPLVRNIGQYIYRAHIAGDYYLNFADASAVEQHDALLVMRYGQRIEDDGMVSFGAWLAERAGLLENGDRTFEAGRSSSPTRELPALFSLAELAGIKTGAPLPRDVWLPGIEVLAARDEAGKAQGFYMAVKGGHNEESHNHNDIGHFVVYRNGEPLIIDAGVETYTRKTFSAQRYEIWTMQSAYHSLPTIGGVQQAAGREFHADDVRRRTNESSSGLTLDIAKAYPAAAGVESWVRSVTLERGREIRLVDTYVLSQEVGSLTLSLMTACAVDLSRPGVVQLGKRELPDGRTAGSGEIHFDNERFSVSLEEVAIGDARMQPVWGKSIYRLLFALRQPGKTGQWELSII